MRFVVIKKFKMSLSSLAYGMWMFGMVWCMWSKDHRLLSDRYIFSSIDHVVRHFYLVFDPGMVITKYKCI